MSTKEENFPTVIIDDKEKDLFRLTKDEADNLFDGEANEYLIYLLVKKNKCLRFTHDFKNEKLYIDFPDIK